MKSKYKLFWLTGFILISALLTACDSSNSKSTDTGGTVDTVSVSGLVRTPGGVTIEGVEAYNSDGVLATSDNSGVMNFTISPDKASSIRLKKLGYSAQTVMLSVNNNSAEFLATLGQRSTAITVSADAEIDITGLSGAMVTLAAGALVDANGNAVTGDIQLSITPVDVSNDDALGVFPGAFAGTDIDGNPTPVIMTYGTVEYYFSQNGNELNLAAGQSATIEIPIYVTLHPDGTPIQIGDSGALWYLNETTGQWLQENTGIVVVSEQSSTGIALRATVTHFSWWNHDIAPEICDLTITHSGLPADATSNLRGSTSTPRPRTGSTTITNTNTSTTLKMPRGTPVGLTGTATASDGVYSAHSFTSCDGPAGTLILEYEGPAPVKILSLTATVKPVFKLDTSTFPPQWAADGNDAIFTWETVAATTRALSSDQGHNTTLGNDFGSTQFPLQLNNMVVPQYNFTLTASNQQGTATETIILDYIDQPKPIVKQYVAYALSSSNSIQVQWQVEGADSVNIGYIENGGSPQAAFPLDGQQNIVAADGFSIIAISDIPNNAVGYDLVARFENQYGETFVQRIISGCLLGSELCNQPF